MPDVGASAAEKKEDPWAMVKSQLDEQMRSPPFDRRSAEYEEEEFAKAKYAELVPWGRDQAFTGLVHSTMKGAETPHGWGILEHHEGFMQMCQKWIDGVANGPGSWAICVPGQEQCGYGTWVNGKRHGYFALVKDGGTYIEEYTEGELKPRRIKWRKDKLHKICSRCNTPFIPSANTFEFKMCRYHPGQAAYDDKFACCGAKKVFNPRGCMRAVHCEAALDEPPSRVAAPPGEEACSASERENAAAAATAACLDADAQCSRLAVGAGSTGAAPARGGF